MSRLAAFGAGLRNKGSVKRALAISTKSYLHTGEIAGYADKVAAVGKAANLIKRGTYIGISLEVAATGLEIQKACALGREEACRKAKYIEGASLAGSLAGTAGGATIGSYALGQLCLAIGLPSGGMGTLACAVIGGAAGGMVAGEYVKGQATKFGDFLYEAFDK